jgi:hypothetical protein
LGGELAWMIGSVSLKSEYLTMQSNDLTLNKKKASFDNTAGYASRLVSHREENPGDWLPTDHPKPFKQESQAIVGLQLVGHLMNRGRAYR